MTDPIKEATLKKWAVVINRSAGGGLGARENLYESLQALFQENGLEVEVHVVSGGEIEKTIRSAISDGMDGIAAGGGDGTILSLIHI